MSQAGPVEILIATANPGKAREIEAVLNQAFADARPEPVIRWRTLRELPAPITEPEEDRDTFAGNAARKARHYSTKTGLWTLADDSGLEVDALGGAPSVRSARYADLPETASRAVRDPANNRKLLEQLKGVPVERRTARFRCALALADGDRLLATAEGAIEGRIIDEPRGDGGFGYDPHFLVPALGKTTAELSAAQKNRISHRGRALRAMSLQLRRLLSDEES